MMIGRWRRRFEGHYDTRLPSGQEARRFPGSVPSGASQPRPSSTRSRASSPLSPHAASGSEDRNFRSERDLDSKFRPWHAVNQCQTGMSWHTLSTPTDRRRRVADIVACRRAHAVSHLREAERDRVRSRRDHSEVRHLARAAGGDGDGQRLGVAAPGARDLDLDRGDTRDRGICQ